MCLWLGMGGSELCAVVQDITEAEFVNFFTDVSATCKTDEDFRDTVRRMWRRKR